MKKKIVCPECDGREYIPHVETWEYENGLGGGQAWNEKCTNCNGTGEIEIPMTNYDYIKSLSIEDMAEHFAMHREPHFPSSPCYVCEYNNPWFCEKIDECNDEYRKAVYKQWLGQEYKGD